MAIDFGTRRVGIALGDDDLGLAFPQKEKSVSEQLMREMCDVVESHNVQYILVGLPLQMGGEDSSMTELARQFAEELEDYLLARNINVAVDFWDERYSSKMVKHYAREIGETDKSMRGKVDSAAAATLLQAYFDSLGKSANFADFH